MTSVIILGFLAGVLFVGGLPAFVKGSMGKSYIRGMDSALASVVWGWACWVVAVLLWHLAPMASHPRAAFLATAGGVLVSGLVLSTMRSKEVHKK